MTTYGLTSTGFVTKDYDTIEAELIADFQECFGSDIDTSAESVAGQYIGNLALKISELWEILAAIYASFNPDSNTGVSLDGALALVGTQRLDAAQSSAEVVLYGAESTSIPVGHLVKMENGYIWELESDTAVEITEDSMVDCQIQLVDDPTTGIVYTITLDSVAYSYTALVTDTTKAQIITALKALVDAGAIIATVTTSLPDSETLRIRATDGVTTFTSSLTATLEYSVQGTPSTYLCQTEGAIAAPSGTINAIQQSVVGLDSVNNLADATQGRAIETDSAARVRRREALASNACGSVPALEAQLKELDNVTFARVFNNRTDAVDGDGRPAHSIECVVLGGDDEEIADLIWNIGAGGIETYGNTYYDITDDNGETQRIYFSRPTSLYIWMDITVSRTTEEDFPDDGADVIIDAILDWVDANITIGGDIFYQRFNGPIYDACSGISELDVQIGYSTDPLTPPVSYAAANISVSVSQIGVFSEDRINVSVT